MLKCPNYGRGRGVRAKSERPNFLRPYLPKGGEGQRRLGQCPKFGRVFFMAPLRILVRVEIKMLSIIEKFLVKYPNIVEVSQISTS